MHPIIYISYFASHLIPLRSSSLFHLVGLKQCCTTPRLPRAKLRSSSIYTKLRLSFIFENIEVVIHISSSDLKFDWGGVG